MRQLFNLSPIFTMYIQIHLLILFSSSESIKDSLTSTLLFLSNSYTNNFFLSYGIFS